MFGLSSRFAGHFGTRSAVAFSTLSPILATKLKDPSLVDCGTVSKETFGVFDPGASVEQFSDGTAEISQVRRMGREDTRRVSYCFIMISAQCLEKLTKIVRLSRQLSVQVQLWLVGKMEQQERIDQLYFRDGVP